MRAARIVLGALGVSALLWSGWLLVSTQRPDQLLNLALWLAAAVILHDFVIVPAITVMKRSRPSLVERPSSPSLVERAKRDETD
ncbi:hypothetical protein OED01_15935 [Microbacterium sp. M28]|uniref:hypothetical protein n=1 Tax=Microbacterium sp. M28 TaxID=2962064 RepID=UPI0021F41345|nr:hypothetical protein [Microbacterium sp. M28]UYO97068.1 hypothetical protein OED01_15935 [Microbacterium sp. M28]